ncbi:MAG TPA: response regulator transcription factor [Segetibacter sp.]
MIRVAIFEDNNSLRDSLSGLIESCDDFELAGSWPDAKRLSIRLTEAKPDIVLMDINMPGISGIEAAGIIKKDFPQIQILMQTVFDDDDKIFASICAGASGYILKNTHPSRLIEALKEINEGGAAFTPAIAKKVLMMAASATTTKPEYILLSEREKQVLQKLVEGLSYKMIAAALDITFDTVHSHIKKIYEKLHVNSKGEAVAKAINHRLV